MNVLNIPVSPALLDAWRGWLAPARQPFYLTEAEARRLDLPTLARASVTLTPEERDTFTLWNVAPVAERLAWLTPADVDALTPAARRELLRAQVRHGRGNVPLGARFADLRPGLPAGRFLWRPGDLTGAVLARLIGQGARSCRRQEVADAVWNAAAHALPDARTLAGTFPAGSAGNCFGTVMGAAGVPDAAHTWMQREPFEAFLHGRTVPGGQDGQPGTLLLWRSGNGLAQHAAVTLGGGWALHKPAQTWWTPRTVLSVPELKTATRTRGWRLERRTLT
ncbi:hypothetical protein [Deinococcus knuensis]|uniref:Peptidase n=1 Tax=Deinococcus knuensis TaxID=1837380 RepID=A0ABQ2SL03_9DEIO|nr:hypothetical protein [Deinococcus knuensis]GGS32737.1 hypothetical protein GCM10008961_25510 [Deinococcus knuensis]